MDKLTLISNLLEKMQQFAKDVPPAPPAAVPAPAPAAAAPAAAPAASPAAQPPNPAPGKGQCQKCAKNKMTGGCQAYRQIPGKYLTGVEKCKYFSPKKDPMAALPKPALPSPAVPGAPANPVAPVAPPAAMSALVEDVVGEILVPSEEQRKPEMAASPLDTKNPKIPLPPGVNPDMPGKGQCFRCKKNNLDGSCEAYAAIPPEHLSGVKQCQAFSNKDPLLTNPLQELNRPAKKPKKPKKAGRRSPKQYTRAKTP